MLPGIREVADTLIPAVASAWTIASWLTSPQPSLNGAAPLERLRAGGVDVVLAAARRTARSMAA